MSGYRKSLLMSLITAQALHCNVPIINHGMVSIKHDGALSEHSSPAKMLTGLVGVESTLTISCENGYALSGNREISCDRYGKWIDATPTCTGNITQCQEMPLSQITNRPLAPSLEVIKLEFILQLKIKLNDLLLVDTCPQAAKHYTRFFL